MESKTVNTEMTQKIPIVIPSRDRMVPDFVDHNCLQGKKITFPEKSEKN